MHASIPLTLALLTLAIAVLLILLPPEQTLGNIIKAVFLHGALVETGLVAFAAAGLLGLAYLVSKKASLYAWCLAAQKISVLLWVIYVLSSIVTTYLAWGVAIAWEEPRVQASAQVLGACIFFLILTLWVKHRTFTAGVNILMAGLSWGLTQSAINLRHPLNPIGTSDSVAFKGFFLALLISLLLMAVQMTRWLHKATPENLAGVES